MFTGEEDSPKLANANKIMLHRKQQELARAQANKGLSVCVCVCARARAVVMRMCVLYVYMSEGLSCRCARPQ